MACYTVLFIIIIINLQVCNPILNHNTITGVLMRLTHVFFSEVILISEVVFILKLTSFLRSSSFLRQFSFLRCIHFLRTFISRIFEVFLEDINVVFTFEVVLIFEVVFSY